MDGLPNAVVSFLALLGVVALVLRLFRSATRAMVRAAEIAAASGMEEASVRRGDLTSLAEARETASAARSRRRRLLVLTAFWATWLIVPLAAGLAREGWALAAPLWMLRFVRREGVRR